jgi:hypothetical protein
VQSSHVAAQNIKTYKLKFTSKLILLKRPTPFPAKSQLTVLSSHVAAQKVSFGETEILLSRENGHAILGPIQ